MHFFTIIKQANHSQYIYIVFLLRKNTILGSDVWKCCWRSMTLHCPWPSVGETSASSQAKDGQRQRNRIILWWMWFTDLNCSVHGVAHSYIAPCQWELKLQEFKVTLMFICSALSSTWFHFYLPANSSQSAWIPLQATVYSLHCLLSRANIFRKHFLMFRGTCAHKHSTDLPPVSLEKLN